MGWEERRGRRYYYRKRREGGRVISEYLGSGPLAELAAANDASMQRASATMREHIRQAQAKRERAEALLDTLERITEALTEATLLVEGYHLHRGQWRKRRDGQKGKRR